VRRGLAALFAKLFVLYLALNFLFVFGSVVVGALALCTLQTDKIIL
jgi:hypothetical protein